MKSSAYSCERSTAYRVIQYVAGSILILTGGALVVRDEIAAGLIFGLPGILLLYIPALERNFRRADISNWIIVLLCAASLIGPALSGSPNHSIAIVIAGIFFRPWLMCHLERA